MTAHTTDQASRDRRATARAQRRAYDRGPRPWMRGRLHSSAAWYFGGAGTALAGMALSQYGWSLLTFVTLLYSLCLAGMLGVSALYHRAPWRSAETIDKWRRADHAMIAVFIAGTYGPLTVGAFGTDWFDDGGGFSFGGLWILVVCWVAALAAVALNIVWINHPRWLAVTIYLCLGWLAIIGLVGYFQAFGWLVSLLMIVGGLVYSAGAIIYARKWPNPSDTWFGFHEVFHATTILAAALHHIAIWLVVLPHT